MYTRLPGVPTAMYPQTIYLLTKRDENQKNMWRMVALEVTVWLELVHSLAVVSIWLVFFFSLHRIFVRRTVVHQRHVIQYRFVPEKKRWNERNYTISMDRQQQQLCTNRSGTWKQSAHNVRRNRQICVSVHTAQVIEIQAHRWFLGAQKLVCWISTRIASIRIAHESVHLFSRLVGPLQICLSKTTQLINNIIWSSVRPGPERTRRQALQETQRITILIDFNIWTRNKDQRINSPRDRFRRAQSGDKPFQKIRTYRAHDFSRISSLRNWCWPDLGPLEKLVRTRDLYVSTVVVVDRYIGKSLRLHKK